MSELYSIEWFREVIKDNPDWLGIQALKLMEHYEVLEAELEHYQRFKLYLEVVCGLDTNEEWEATESMEEEA